MALGKPCFIECLLKLIVRTANDSRQQQVAGESSHRRHLTASKAEGSQAALALSNDRRRRRLYFAFADRSLPLTVILSNADDLRLVLFPRPHQQLPKPRSPNK